MEGIKEYLTIPYIFIFILHIAGFCFLYINRVHLLYDDEDCDKSTPPTLSLGRCWSWMLFYIATSFWVRYSIGVIPITTPFPPALEEMLFACIAYEFAKKGLDIGKIWALRRGISCDSLYTKPNKFDRYPGNPRYEMPKPSEHVSMSEGSRPMPPSSITSAKAYSDDDNSTS